MKTMQEFEAAEEVVERELHELFEMTLRMEQELTVALNLDLEE